MAIVAVACTDELTSEPTGSVTAHDGSAPDAGNPTIDAHVDSSAPLLDRCPASLAQAEAHDGFPCQGTFFCFYEPAGGCPEGVISFGCTANHWSGGFCEHMDGPEGVPDASVDSGTSSHPCDSLDASAIDATSACTADASRVDADTSG
jgi:hypothetical protein